MLFFLFRNSSFNLRLPKNSLSLKVVSSDPYPWIPSSIKEEQIVLADRCDISAMKLSTITNRGLKRIIDIYFLLKKFSLSEMLNFYKQKFSDGTLYLVLKSLTYFEDADDEMPLMLADID